MVVLIDTNVIIDFLVAREPFYDSALHVMEKCASGEAEGYMAFHSLTNLWYILRKSSDRDKKVMVRKNLQDSKSSVCISRSSHKSY